MWFHSKKTFRSCSCFLISLCSSICWCTDSSSDVELKKLKNRIETRFGPEWIDGQLQSPKNATTRKLLPTSHWLPMCFFFDEAVSQLAANEKIKTLSKNYASCGIALEPLSFTIKSNYPTHTKELQRLAKIACPIPSIYGVRGSIQIETRHDQLPGEMCNLSGAKGCSTLCSPLSFSLTSMNLPASVAMHESMHSNCCGPVCVDKGGGTGRDAGLQLELAGYSSKKQDENQAQINVNANLSTDLTKAGCQALRAGASKNEFHYFFEPEKTNYYAVEKNPGRQVDLNASKSVLKIKQMPMTSPRVSAPPSKEALDDVKNILSQRTYSSSDSDTISDDPAPSLPNLNTMTSITASNAAGRDRGKALRKQNSIRRKSTGSNIGIINAYESKEDPENMTYGDLTEP